MPCYPWARMSVATLKIDEQSLVYTAAYAKEHGIWPRLAPLVDGHSTVQEDDLDLRVRPGRGSTGNRDAPGQADPAPVLPAATTVRAEGVLKEALTRLWEQARTRKFAVISTLQLRLYDTGDGFRLLGLVGAIPKASKRVAMQGSYETAEGSTL